MLKVVEREKTSYSSFFNVFISEGLKLDSATSLTIQVVACLCGRPSRPIIL